MSSLTAGLSGGIKKLPKSTYLIGGTVLIAVVLIGGSFVYSKKDAKQETKLNAGLEKVLPSSWLIKYFGHDDEYDVSIAGPTGDPDGDILTNYQEFYFNTDPTNPDTDGDGQFDGAEVVVNSNPNGAGKLYSDTYTRNFAKEYIEKNNISQFKEENIESTVLGLLNPPISAEVFINLPETKTLNIIKDRSEAAAEKYLNGISGATDQYNLSDQYLQTLVQSPGSEQIKGAVTNLYSAIERLRLLEVPEPFVNFHRLQIAGLFEAANALEATQSIDLRNSLESQQTQTQKIYYHLAVIEKINAETNAYLDTLGSSYANLFQKINGS